MKKLKQTLWKKSKSLIYINNTANSPNNNNKKDKSFLGKNAEENNFNENNPNEKNNFNFSNKDKIQEETVESKNTANITTKKAKEEKKEQKEQQEQKEINIQSEKEINKQIFGYGITLLNDIGIQDNKQARRIIGKWLKTNSRIDVLKFIKKALERKILDPVSWIAKQLQKQTEDYKQKQAEKALKKAGKCKKEQSSLPDSLYPELKTIKDKITKLNKWQDNGDIIIDDELLNSLTAEEKNLLLENTPEEYFKEYDGNCSNNQ